MTSHIEDATRALRLLDLTDLADDASESGLLTLCERAIGGPATVAAICIWPRFITSARAHLAGTPVAVATVVNFPQGGTEVAPVLLQTEQALADGADEIDLVLPWRAFLSGDSDSAGAMVEAVRARCGEKLLKVILETGEYPDTGSIRTASELAIAAGADFIKTSTGKTSHSASPEAARIMLETIRDSGRPVGLKPSGGIRTLEDARTYLALADTVMGRDWATPKTFRFGASGLYQSLVATLGGAVAQPASGPY